MFNSFQTLAPRNENALWHLLVFLRGDSKLVSQFLKFTISRVEFLVNKVERQVGARPLIDLKTMIMISDNDKYPSDMDPVNSAKELRAPVHWNIPQAMGA